MVTEMATATVVMQKATQCCADGAAPSAGARRGFLNAELRPGLSAQRWRHPRSCVVTCHPARVSSTSRAPESPPPPYFDSSAGGAFDF
jgi:hypothetical protein